MSILSLFIQVKGWAEHWICELTEILQVFVPIAMDDGVGDCNFGIILSTEVSPQIVERYASV